MGFKGIHMSLLRRFTRPPSNLRVVPTRCLSDPAVRAQRNDELFTKLPPSSMQPKRLVPIRGYMYLPGNQSPEYPAYLKGPTEDFPFGVQCGARDNFSDKDWALAIRESIDELLPKYKAVLFRGVPLKDGVAFNKLVQDTGYSSLAYKFGTDRRNNVAGNVYAASNEPPPCIIEMHNEASYSPYKLVRKLFFFCQSPSAPEFGGETPICKTNRFMTSLDQNFIAKLKDKQIRYLRILADRKIEPEMSWQNIMMVETKEEAEADMKRLGIGWRWNPNGSLVYWHKKSGFQDHPETGEELWYNQATSHHRSYYDHLSTYIPSSNFEDYPGGFHSQYGDGTEIEDEYLAQVRALSWQEAVGVRLEAGDILVLDNLHCQHGRLNYHGTRKVCLSLTTD